MLTYGPIIQKRYQYIIDFEIIKDVAKIYFSIKASLTSKLSSDYSLIIINKRIIIININNKVVKKMQSYILYNKKQIKIFLANK